MERIPIGLKYRKGIARFTRSLLARFKGKGLCGYLELPCLGGHGAYGIGFFFHCVVPAVALGYDMELLWVRALKLAYICTL